jgi:hypothetical protein
VNSAFRPRRTPASPNHRALAAPIESLESRELLAAVFSIQTTQPQAREGSIALAEFRITNSGSDWGAVTWQVVPDSAHLASDLPEYPDGGESHTIWIAPGGEAFATPLIVNDDEPEPTETFNVKLSLPPEMDGSGASIAHDTAGADILDDDVFLYAVSKTVTAGDEIEWAVHASDYYGRPASGIAVFVIGGQGPVGTLFPHDLTNANGDARIGLRGTGSGWGYVTVRAFGEGNVDARSQPWSFWHRSAPPVMKWINPIVESEQQLSASFDGLVKLGLELWKWDASAPLARAGLPIEWGMDHSGAYEERQADLAGSDSVTDDSGRACAWVDGNVVQRLLRDMDPTPTGSTSLWAKYPLTFSFKRITVRSRAPVIDLRVATNVLRTVPPGLGYHKASFYADVKTPQGLPIVNSHVVVTTLEATDDLLGFLFNSGGGGPSTNTVYSAASDENGRATFNAKVTTFAPVGTVATAQLVAQSAADSYYSWRNADVEIIQIM